LTSLETDEAHGHMSTMPLEICDFHNGRRWVRLTIADALARIRRGKMMRCPECHGQVVPFRAYKTGARAHFEHRHAHYGCSFSEALDGARSPHSQPLE